MNFDDRYLTVSDLTDLDWTRGLIKLYLGAPDRLLPVNHWKNWSGKKAWHSDTVDLIEMTQGFELSFLRSAKIRRLSRERVEAVIERIYTAREISCNKVEEIPSDAIGKAIACLASAAEVFAEARRRGYRTPHKC